jgi:DNA-binding response OmpR family regulator
MNTVLVIDDESEVREGIARVLRRAGFTVRTIDNVEDAMQELRREPADAVITDMLMPKLDGLDAIHRIRGEFPLSRILAISGGGNFDLASTAPRRLTTNAHLVAAQRSGAHLILKKPFESRELIEAVRELLQGNGS